MFVVATRQTRPRCELCDLSPEGRAKEDRRSSLGRAVMNLSQSGRACNPCNTIASFLVVRNFCPSFSSAIPCPQISLRRPQSASSRRKMRILLLDESSRSATAWQTRTVSLCMGKWWRAWIQGRLARPLLANHVVHPVIIHPWTHRVKGKRS